MAFTVPGRLPARDGHITPGERKVFAALRDHLPEDYVVYYNVRVGDRHPDFIVLGPDLGLVVLEVKDWRLSSIAETGPDGVRIRTSDGDRLVRNPVDQARGYALTIVDCLKQRPGLRAGNQLCVGWAYGAVLPRLSRPDVRTPSLFGPSLEEALGAGRVLSADDLSASELLPRLRALLGIWAERTRLTPAQANEIRAALYPEIHLGWGNSDGEIFQVMDQHQERLALSLGEGHRLLRGVAGSGKTITLMCRARHLRKLHPDWHILVLCFNRVLARHLRERIGADERLHVSSFHAWCRRRLLDAGIAVPSPPGRDQPPEYWDSLPRLLLDARAAGKIAGPMYQAILVDEGQDFADDWYRAILGALDPATNSLLIALDSSQNIYRRRISWRELGIQARGRSQVLRVNYRNTKPILAAGYRLISDLDSHAARGPELAEEYVTPDRALRDGPPPELRQHASREAGRRFALEWIQTRLARGAAPATILVLALGRPQLESVGTWLESAGLSTSRLWERPSPGTVRLSTIHGAKGLDAAHVLLLDADELERCGEEKARRLLYIAMTRASEEVCICYRGRSRLMAELAAAIAGPGGNTQAFSLSS